MNQFVVGIYDAVAILAASRREAPSFVTARLSQDGLAAIATAKCEADAASDERSGSACVAAADFRVRTGVLGTKRGEDALDLDYWRFICHRRPLTELRMFHDAAEQSVVLDQDVFGWRGEHDIDPSTTARPGHNEVEAAVPTFQCGGVGERGSHEPSNRASWPFPAPVSVRSGELGFVLVGVEPVLTEWDSGHVRVRPLVPDDHAVFAADPDINGPATCPCADCLGEPNLTGPVDGKQRAARAEKHVGVLAGSFVEHLLDDVLSVDQAPQLDLAPRGCLGQDNLHGDLVQHSATVVIHRAVLTSDLPGTEPGGPVRCRATVTTVTSSHEGEVA